MCAFSSRLALRPTTQVVGTRGRASLCTLQRGGEDALRTFLRAGASAFAIGLLRGRCCYSHLRCLK